MTASARAMAFMSALMAMGGTMPPSLSAAFASAGRSKRRHPHRTTWGLSKYHQPTQRLRLSRGPGSISAKADIQQLCNNGQYLKAREMAKEHEHQCGESLFPGAWWRSDETPADNC